MRLRAVTAIVPLLWLGCCVVSGLPDDEEAAGGELRTDKTLMINEGEGSLDIYDEGFVYNHNQSMMSCPPETENQLADPSEFGVGCWPLGRLLLHPEEHAGAATLLREEEWVQLNDSVGNLIDQMDTGVDADGDPIGGGGDGKIVPEELANRVYSALRTWQYETDRLWMDKTDANADGLVEFNEVAPASENEDPTTMLSRFNFADSDKDGWLSETDVGLFRNPLWFSRMHQWALGAMVLELSADDNANISRAEYTAPDTPDKPFGWEVRVPSYVKDREFTRLDKDGSGSLDLREASQIPEVRLASIITHGVHALLHACDQNSDGSLDTDEVVARSAEFAKAPPLAARPWDDSETGLEHEEL